MAPTTQRSQTTTCSIPPEINILILAFGLGSLCYLFTPDSKHISTKTRSSLLYAGGICLFLGILILVHERWHCNPASLAIKKHLTQTKKLFCLFSFSLVLLVGGGLMFAYSYIQTVSGDDAAVKNFRTGGMLCLALGLAGVLISIACYNTTKSREPQSSNVNISTEGELTHSSISPLRPMINNGA